MKQKFNTKLFIFFAVFANVALPVLITTFDYYRKGVPYIETLQQAFATATFVAAFLIYLPALIAYQDIKANNNRNLSVYRKPINKMENNIVPSVGRIVVYNPTQKEQAALQTIGCNASKELPAVIVAVWGDQPGSAVNLKVMIDGPHADVWKTSISCATANETGEYPEGSWHWPERK